MTQDTDVAMNLTSTSRKNITQDTRRSALSRVRSRLTHWASVGVVMSGLMLPISTVQSHPSDGFDQNLGIQDLVHEGVSTANKQAAWANPTESSLLFTVGGSSASVGDTVGKLVNPLDASLSFDKEYLPFQTQPKLRNDASSTLNYLEFSGGDKQSMYVDTGANLSASSTLNLFYLVEPKSTNNYASIIGVGASGTAIQSNFATQDGSWQLSPVDGDIHIIAAYNGGAVLRVPLFPTSELIDGERHLITMSMNPSTKNTQVFLDGELKFDAALDSDFTNARKTGFYRLFGNRAFTKFMEGDLYEMMLFENLTDNDVEVVNGYLLCKWGISAPPGAAAKTCAATSANPDTDTFSVRIDNTPQVLTNLHANDAFQPLVGVQTTETRDITPVTANASLTTVENFVSTATSSAGHLTYVPHISEMGKTVTYTYKNIYTDINETDVSSEVVTNSIIITEETDNISMIASHEERLIGDDVTVTATLKDTADAPYPDGTTIAGFFTIDSGNGALSTADCVVSGGAGECSTVLTNAGGADGDITVVKGALNDVVTIDTKSVTWLEPVTTVPLVDAPLCNPSTTLGGWTGGTPPQGTVSANSSSDDGSVTSVWTANQGSNLGADLYPRWPSFGSTADGGFQGRISSKITAEQNLTIAFDSNPASGLHFRLNDFSGTENATITAKNASGDTIYPQYTFFSSGTVFSGANLNTIWANGGSRLITFTFAEPVTEIKLFDVSSTGFITFSQFSCPPFVLTAISDDYTATPIDSLTGGTAGNVVANDTLAYVGGTITGPTIGTDVRDVTLYTTTAQDGTTTLGLASGSEPSNGSITMGADGSLQVAAGTTDGTYDYTYQICDATDAGSCKTAVAKVTVALSNVDLSIAATAQAAEDASNGEFTFTLDKALTVDLAIPLTLSGTATDGTDMSAIPTSVTIPAGQTSVTLPVTVTADSISEADETVIVTITTASLASPGVNFNVSTNSETVTITDDDVPTPTVDSTSPSPANDGTVVTTELSGVKEGATVTIPGMTCLPSPATAAGTVTCTGTVGENGLDGTDTAVTVTDAAGNTNTDASSGLVVDNNVAAPTVDSTSPSPANDGTVVTTELSGVEEGATITIPGMTCLPSPATAAGTVTCTGTVGENGLDGTDTAVTITDEAGNTNTDASSGLVVDNNVAAPTVDSTSPSPANDGTVVTTELSGVEEGATVSIPGMTCLPSPATAAGTVTCTGTVGENGLDGTDTAVTVTDAAGNTNSDASSGLVVDNNVVAPTVDSTSPSPANDGTVVTTELSGVEEGATVTIPGMTCLPSPATAAGTVTCTGTVGENGLDGTDTAVTVTDEAGNTNSDASSGLVVDNSVAAPTVDSTSPSPANDGTVVTTELSGVEEGATVTIPGMTCLPSPATAAGTVTCTGTVGENGLDGTDTAVTVTDEAGNTNTGASSGLVVDNVTAAPTVDSTSPSPANDGTVVTTELSGVEEGATVTIPGMTCLPSPATAAGTVTCTGTVGENGLDGTDTAVTVTDEAGNTNTDASSGLVVDNVTAAPTVDSTSPSPANDGTVVTTELSGVEEGATVTIPGMTCLPSPATAAGTVTCTGTVGENGLDGSDTAVTVTDAAGNTNTDASSGLVVDNETTAPTVDSTSPSPANDGTVVTTELSGVEEGATVTIPGMTCLPSPATAAGTVTCTGTVGENGLDGTDTAVTVTDEAGNTNTDASSGLVVDNNVAAPTVDSTSPSPANDGTVVTTELSGVEEGATVTIPGMTCLPSPATAAGTVTCTGTVGENGLDGTNTAVTVTDAAGNTNTDASSGLVVDNNVVAPTVDSTSPSPANDGTVVTTELSGVEEGATVTIPGMTCLPSPATAAGTVTCTGTVGENGLDGTDTAVTVTDAAGNTNTDASSGLVVDNNVAAPTVDSTSPSPANDGTVVTTELSGVEEGATVTIPGMTCLPSPATAAGTVTCTGTVGENGLDGTDTAVTVTDEAGNTNTDASSGLVVDNETAAPTVDSTSPSPANDGAVVTTELSGVEEGATVTIPGMTCLPSPATAAGTVTCTGTVGENGLDGTNTAVTVTDAAGNTNTDASSGLVVDNNVAGPTVDSTSPSPANDGTVVTTELSGVEEGATVTIPGMTCLPSPATAAGTVTCTGTVGENGLDGTDTAVTVTDEAGNTNTDASSGLVVDNVTAAPTVDSTSPSPANDGTVVTTELSGVEEGATVTIPGMTCLPSPATAAGTVTCTGTVGENGLDGTDTAVTVTDEAGNTNTDASSGLVVDNVTAAPTVDSTSPSPANDGTVVTTELSGVEEGATVTIPGMTCLPSPATAAGTVTCTGTVGENGLDGTDTAVTVTDAAGNTNADASSGLVVDNVTAAPTVDSTSPSPANDGTVITTELSGVEEGATVTIPGMTCLPSPATAAGTVTCTGTVGENGLDGTDTAVTVTDAAGNTNTDASSGLAVDNTTPSAPNVEIKDNGDELLSEAEIAAGVIATITTPADSVANDTLTVDTNGDGNADHTVVLTSAQASGGTVDILVAAAHIPNDDVLTVTAEVTDIAGNTGGSANDTSTSDSTAPILTAVDIAPTSDLAPTLSGTTDQADGSTVTITDGSGNILCTATVASGAWSCIPAADLTYGTQNLVATISDTAGNTTTVSFIVEIGIDTDNDGLLNNQDLDDDNDGIPDLVELADDPTRDTDSDGIIDSLDLDSDNDGIVDIVEAGGEDSDKNGRVDNTNDTDNDGLADSVDANPETADAPTDLATATAITTLALTDTDSDGTPNFQDVDSDNDGLSDLVEAGIDPANDTDNDGHIDINTPADVDINGLSTAITLISEAVDTDGDGVPDFQDLDSDNDGLTDIEEIGGLDVDGNGEIDTPNVLVDQSNILDENADGIPDVKEPNNPNLAASLDSNGDGIIDDASDTDGDGIPDVNDVTPTIYGTLLDTDRDHIPDTLDLDDDNDGIPDLVEIASAQNGGDTDGDGIADQIDMDSDGDGINDLYESGLNEDQIKYLDSNNDGIIDSPVGANGLSDAIETDDTDSAGQDFDNDGTTDTPADTDADGRPDYQDLDSDNDGIHDLSEGSGLDAATVDTNNDGVIDDNGTDADGDGIADSVDTNNAYHGSQASLPADQDIDGMPDYRDLDSDSDGIFDLVEGGTIDPTVVDSDENGVIDNGTVDTDFDGIPDVADSTPSTYASAQASAINDTDGDSVPDHKDLDSDNDGLLDTKESGNPDKDHNGLLDVGATALRTSQIIDTDGDGIPDFQELDSDNDGVFDIVLSQSFNQDDNNDGMIDDMTDVDKDGIADVADGLFAGHGSASAGSLSTAVSGFGGSMSLLGLLMMTLLLGFSRFGGIKLFKRLLPMLLVMFFIAPAVMPNTAHAEEKSKQQKTQKRSCGTNLIKDGYYKEFTPCNYVAAGYSSTHIDPEKESIGFSTSDNKSNGYNVVVGRHFAPHWFAELSYADMGEATLSNVNPAIQDENISYKVPSLHLGYLVKAPDNELNFYVKGGVSAISNEASNTDIFYDKETEMQASFGLGAQWQPKKESGLFMRVGADFIDRDAIALGINVGYKFKSSTKKVYQPKQKKTSK